MEVINNFIDRYKIPIGITLVGIVLILGHFFFDKKATTTSIYPKDSIVSKTISKDIKVDVSGAVVTPGVYTMSTDSRIEDVIAAAQGFSADVNKEFVAKNLNLAQKVTDGLKIYIPFSSEQNTAVISPLGHPQNQVVGINSASMDQLDRLPGVGTVTASKIISARPFSSLDDLLTKKIVSKSVFEKIKDLISLN